MLKKCKLQDEGCQCLTPKKKKNLEPAPKALVGAGARSIAAISVTGNCLFAGIVLAVFRFVMTV